MNIKEILAKMKADDKFDGAAAFNALLAASLESVNSKNTELLGKLSQAKTLTDGIPEGFTPTKWKELLELEKNVDTSKLKGTEQLEALKLQLNEAHGLINTKNETEIKGLTTALERELVDNAVTTAVNQVKGNAELLLPHIRTFVNMQKNEDGSFSSKVVDSKGTERYSMTKAGERMGVTELVAEMKSNPIYAPAFAASNSGGGAGGAGGGAGGGVVNPFLKGDTFSFSEQSKIMNTDPGLGNQLKQEAANANKK